MPRLSLKTSVNSQRLQTGQNHIAAEPFTRVALNSAISNSLPHLLGNATAGTRSTGHLDDSISDKSTGSQIHRKNSGSGTGALRRHFHRLNGSHLQVFHDNRHWHRLRLITRLPRFRGTASATRLNVSLALWSLFPFRTIFGLEFLGIGKGCRTLSRGCLVISNDRVLLPNTSAHPISHPISRPQRTGCRRNQRRRQKTYRSLIA